MLYMCSAQLAGSTYLQKVVFYTSVDLKRKQERMGCCSDRCSNLGLELILVFFGIFMTVGFAITYIIAVQQGHVTAYLPYISDTGGKVPESCVFTFICSIGAIFLCVIVCLRFKHLHHYYHFTLREMHCLNVTSLVFGLLSALGLVIVGSFQNDSVATVHFIGAFMVFGFGVIYSWSQTLITLRLWRSRMTPYVGCCLVIFRAAVALFSTLMLVTAITAGVYASYNHTKVESKDGSFFWEPGDGGYALHVVSTAAEWLLGFSFLFFFLTFHPDFTRISLEFGVNLKSHHHTDVKYRHSIISTDSENTPLTI